MNDNPDERGQLPLVVRLPLLILWGTICALMSLSAIIGLVCVVLGAVSLLGGLEGLVVMRLGGMPIQTATQKGLFMVVGLAMVATGAAFWWQARQGTVIGALIWWGALMALFLAIAWAFGSSNVISVGGA
jgi:hypothetical protein